MRVRVIVASTVVAVNVIKGQSPKRGTLMYAEYWWSLAGTTAFQHGLFMNRCDDRAGPLFATGFFEEVRSHCLRTTDKVNCGKVNRVCEREGALGCCAREYPLGEKRFVANQEPAPGLNGGTSEGAAVFMNNPG